MRQSLPSLYRWIPSWFSNYVRGTAAQIFIIIMIVLLPLAALATLLNWQSISAADKETRELLETATLQNANQLASNISAIRTAQELTANVLATEADPGNICERLHILMRTMGGTNGIQSILFAADGRYLCGTENSASLQAHYDAVIGDDTALLVPEMNGLLIQSRSPDRRVTAMALYRISAMLPLLRTNTRDPDHWVILRKGAVSLILTGAKDQPPDLETMLAAQAPVGDLGVEMIVAIDDRGTALSRALALFMPLVLLFSAAFMGWLVVRWILIKPLISLQREVANYVPGTIINPPEIKMQASSEITALGAAFHEMSEDVAEHEEEMRQALERQTKLTREVHHRVKNNLQIISSLISLHWRASQDEKTGIAYLSIQRRVDALAVVQRNHYAELDEKRGVRARPMLNEIASGLQTSAQIQSGCAINIQVTCDDIYLHQDIAAPLAFLTAELTDLLIAQKDDGALRISLSRMAGSPGRARFMLASAAFRQREAAANGTTELYERILTGLARQLRSTLEHNPERGEYHLSITTTL